MIDWAPHAQRLQRAIDRSGDGFWTVERIAAGIEARELQLWPGLRSTGVTEYEAAAGRRTLHILFAAGELAELMQMRECVEYFARSIGADAVTVAGRTGWHRVLLPYGYTVIDNVPTLEL